MKTKIKTLLTALVVLSLMTTAVSAGNIGTAVTNAVTTLTVIMYQTTINILSPADGDRFGRTNVDITYGVTNTAVVADYTLNGVYIGTTGGSPFVVTGVDTGVADGGTDNTVIVNVTDPINGSAQDTVTFKVDITAPAQITGITSTKGTNWINWTWTPPVNTDFNNVIVNVTKTSDSSVVVLDTDVPKGTNYYNATGLDSNTGYTISVKTEDDAPAP